MITVGLDLSLTKTGITILGHGGTVIYSGLVKSKPCGDKPIDETRRIVKIAEEIMTKLGTVASGPRIVAIEGLAFMAKGTSLVQLAGLNYMIRAALDKERWPFIIVAPTTLKKFITGSGKGDKDMISMAIYKNYGFEALDNNVADSFGLAACAMAVMGSPINKITAPQLEVVKLLSKQL